MPDPAGPTWDLHSTPNPSEWAFSVVAPTEQVKHQIDAIEAYQTGAAFQDFPVIPDGMLAANPKFGAYKFANSADNERISKRFYFGKNKTKAQANTPFHRTVTMGNHRWPPILLGVQILPDYGSPRSFPVYEGTTIGTGFGPTYHDQVYYIPDVAEGTRFVKEEFWNSEPYDIPQYPTPVPTAVTYRMPGGESGTFPECLHDRIIIPAMITGQIAIIGGNNVPIGTVLPAQLFPATNFITWAPYVLSDGQEERPGGWYRVRTRVFPPPLPEAIKLIKG